MFNQVRQFSLLVALCFMVMASSGCFALLIGAAAGAGGVAYAKGVLEKNFDQPVERVHKATVSALKNLKLFITEDELKQHSAIVKATFDDGADVKIDISALTEKSSKLSIRVGILGDEVKSQMIMTAISKRL